MTEIRHDVRPDGSPDAPPRARPEPGHDMRQLTARGRSIEDESFAVIDREAGAHPLPPAEWSVVRRVIHATADFELKDLVCFERGAVAAGIAALRAGRPIIVDVKMIAAGLSEERLGAYGCAVWSFISDPDVIAAARAADSTRAIEAMRKAHRQGLLKGAIIAIGNAPTALLEVARLVEVAAVRPALVIAVPVGFVSAAESKEAALALPVPVICVRGRKGGSTIAVAILHALLALTREAA
ncbi:MAG TPA: precorrin-8X methylmutase [Kofleriaceae bacterium]|nr:precorrin-8X methylmutase [Kofleriaceae bacterium]